MPVAEDERTDRGPPQAAEKCEAVRQRLERALPRTRRPRPQPSCLRRRRRPRPALLLPGLHVRQDLRLPRNRTKRAVRSGRAAHRGRGSRREVASGRSSVPRRRRRGGPLGQEPRRSGVSRIDGYDYLDDNGRPVLRVLRFEHDRSKKKAFRQVSFAGDGWATGSLPAPRPLYHLPALIEAKEVLVVEGEKCVEAALDLGFVATTSSHGASSIDKTDWSPLAGKSVAVLPDNDEAGHGYAEAVVERLLQLDPPATARVVELPDVPEKAASITFVHRRQLRLCTPRGSRGPCRREASVGRDPPPAPAGQGRPHGGAAFSLVRKLPLIVPRRRPSSGLDASWPPRSGSSRR